MRALVRLVSFLAVIVAAQGAPRASKAIDGAVNLNTASPDVLALLPGIGPAKAQSILAYRKKHPFRTVDELVRIKGIGRKMVRRLRPHLAVGGPTTASVASTSASTSTAAPVPSAPPPLPSRPKVTPMCARPFVRARPMPSPRVSRVAGGACWPPP